MTSAPALPSAIFPVLDALPAGVAQRVAERLEWLDLPRGAVFFEMDRACRLFPLVVAGEVRVSRLAQSGREIELYRVRAGEICIVSVSCLLGGAAYAARGVAAEEVRLAALPQAEFETLLLQHAAFRQFVFGQFSQRMARLMLKVEEVAFSRLEQRLAGLLAAGPRELAATHQQLADRLGAAREPVSRLLKRFEAQGWVALGRGRIEVRAGAVLAGLGGGSVTAVTEIRPRLS